MKMQGKIKAIPVEIAGIGQQVLYHNKIIVLDIRYIRTGYLPTGVYVQVSALKTLVVEYNEYQNIQPPVKGFEYKQLPLKYSQWQAAIDNKEIDSDKIIEFEEIDLFEKENTGYRTYSRSEMEAMGGNWYSIRYAKIIPQKKVDTHEATLGVGDGSGDLYVHGSYEAIKVLQEKLLKMEKMYTLQDVENIVTKLMHQVHVADEDLIHDHLQYWSIDFKLSPRKWLEHNLQGLKIK